MKTKNAQVSIFLVLGVIILVAASLYFFSAKAPMPGKEDLDLDATGLESYIQKCLKVTAEEGVRYVSLHGGSYQSPESSIFSPYGALPIYYDSGKNTSLSTEDIERNIARYMEEMIPFCMDGFPDIITLEQAIPHARATLLPSRVGISLAYPIKAIQISAEITVRDFSTEINSPLLNHYGAALEIVAEQMADPVDFCISCLLDIGSQRELSIDAQSYNESVIIFTSSSNASSLLPPEFSFASQYAEES